MVSIVLQLEHELLEAADDYAFTHFRICPNECSPFKGRGIRCC